ncbi:hypothetical protein GCM10020331_077100 [Ectobacillus funiculus]
MKERGARDMWQEFKKFAFKGNVMDLAVGVIIGAAFGKNRNLLGRRYYYTARGVVARRY